VSALASPGWSVRPSFVPHGATEPVTLVIDDAAITQLAGEPPVVWQTPWSELSDVELARAAHRMVLVATIGGIRYSWRKAGVEDYDALAAAVEARGGVVRHPRRRFAVVVVAAAVLVASVAAGGVAWLVRRGPNELADARAANLALSDLPSGWFANTQGVLSYLVPPASTVYTSTTTTTTTTTKVNPSFSAAASIFQHCLGVSAARDRIYGAAGQQPDYQVSSPVFESNLNGGGEIASVAQYYKTTAMVRRDTAEMARAGFGRCFVASQAALLLGEEGQSPRAPAGATSWRPRTFLSDWTRGGSVPLDVPLLTVRLDLVVAVITHGHYEVTLDALVPSLASDRGLLNSIVGTLVARATSASARAA
jgi:hypothetical protein